MKSIRFLWRPSLWFYVSSVITALPFALIASSFAYFAYGSHPRGDAVLYDADLSATLEWLIRDRKLVAPLFVGLASVLAIAEYGRLIPLGAALSTVNQHDDQPPYTFGQALSRVAPYFARLSGWVTAVRLLQIITIGLGWLACQGIRGTKVRDLLCLIPLALVSIIVSFLGVAHDCARTQLIQGESRPWTTLKLRGLLRAWLVWFLFAAAGGALVVLGLRANQMSTKWLSLVWLVHQLLHFARSVTFVGWLRYLNAIARRFGQPRAT